MTFLAAAVVMGGATLVSSIIGSKASQNAAETQAQSGQSALDLQRQMYEQQRADLQPYMQAGYGALADLQNLLKGRYSQPFNYNSLGQDAGFQYGLKQARLGAEGMSAKQGAGATYGRTPDTRAMTNAFDMTGRYANQYQNDALQRFIQEKNATLDPYYRLGQLGGQGVSQAGQAASGYGTNAANINVGMGNVAGANMLNQGNIWGGAVNQLGGLGGYVLGQPQTQPTYQPPWWQMGTPAAPIDAPFWST